MRHIFAGRAGRSRLQCMHTRAHAIALELELFTCYMYTYIVN